MGAAILIGGMFYMTEEEIMAEDLDEEKLQDHMQRLLNAFEDTEYVFLLIINRKGEASRVHVCRTELAAKQVLLVKMKKMSEMAVDSQWISAGSMDEKIDRFFLGNQDASYEVLRQMIYDEEEGQDNLV
jgi:hypothetical protein